MLYILPAIMARQQTSKNYLVHKLRSYKLDALKLECAVFVFQFLP
jgi:hypothetical protein